MVATGIGRRITNDASRCQKPSSVLRADVLRPNRRFATRLPATASRAGRTVNDANAAIRATAMPAYAIERSATGGNHSSVERAIATVIEENMTVLPAEPTVVRRAEAISLPASISSRKRFTISRL